MTDVTGPETNCLLNALPDRERRRLLQHAETVPLVTHDILYEQGTPIPYVYFPPRGSVISLLVPDGEREIETALVGQEGMVGVEVFLGGERSQYRTDVQAGWEILRLDVADFRTALKRSRVLSELLQHYLRFLLTQVSQAVSCNRFHSLEANLCYWLLQYQDRLESAEFEITQATIARMLGVRRVGVSQTARKLQDEGLISYRWGKVKVLDRAGLEQRSCTCYARVKQGLDELRKHIQ